MDEGFEPRKKEDRSTYNTRLNPYKTGFGDVLHKGQHEDTGGY